MTRIESRIPFGAVALVASVVLFVVGMMAFGVGDTSQVETIDPTRWSMRAIAVRAGVSNLALVCAIGAFLAGSTADRRRAGYAMVVWLMATAIYTIAAQTIIST